MKSSSNPVSFFNLLLIILSLIVLALFVVELFYSPDPEMRALFNTLDYAICVVFLFDFIKRFIQAPSKLRFMRWGWIDLLASIPAIDILRPGRVFRLVRLLRLMRIIKSVRHLVYLVYGDRSRGVANTVGLLAIVLLMIGSISILYFEKENGMIKTAEDAIWWSFVTITTVGYGDFYPVTTGGRVIAGLMMICGVGLFGTLSATLAKWFLENVNEKSKIPPAP